MKKDKQKNISLTQEDYEKASQILLAEQQHRQDPKFSFSQWVSEKIAEWKKPKPEFVADEDCVVDVWFMVDASVSTTIQAKKGETKWELVDRAIEEDEEGDLSTYLCHHCSSKIQVGDLIEHTAEVTKNH